MTEFAHILLASHDTPGARAAEAAALQCCSAGGLLSHLIVVPDLWRGMMGDDWLNNAATRDAYGKHLENQLQREIQSHIERLRPAVQGRGLRYEFKVVCGDPTQCLVDYSRALAANLVLIGAPRPKGMAGLRSRMKPERLVAELATPLLVIPHPR